MQKLGWLVVFVAAGCALPRTVKDRGIVCISPVAEAGQDVKVTYTQECVGVSNKNVRIDCTASLNDDVLEIDGRIRFTPPVWSELGLCTDHVAFCTLEGGFPDSGTWSIAYDDFDNQIAVPTTDPMCFDLERGVLMEADTPGCEC